MDEFHEKYYCLGEIFKNNNTTVFKLSRKDDGSFVACKKIKCKRSRGRRKFKNEIDVLDLLKKEIAPNVIQLMSHSLTSKYMLCYTEFYIGGDLQHYIGNHRKRGEDIRPMFIRQVVKQVCEALHFIHESLLYKDKKIIHRDIKPANIFIDRNFNIKLGDFGFAIILKKDDPLPRRRLGTFIYMSPEAQRGQQQNTSTDMFSLGCTLFQLCTLEYPLMNPNNIRIKDTLELCNFSDCHRLRDLSRVEGYMKGLIEELTRREPTERLTANEVLQKNFIRDY